MQQLEQKKRELQMREYLDRQLISPIYSHLYFRVVRQLAKLLMHTAVAERLRQQGRKVMETDSYPVSDVKDFERLSPRDRPVILGMSAWLLEEWPNRFVKICRDARIFSSVLFRDMSDPPYWYWRVVREHLFVAYTPWKSNFTDAANSYRTLVI